MSKNIKGITIELDGDTSGLTKALKTVDSETKSVQNELKQVDRLLKFDPSNVDLLAQKQKLLGDAVDNTSKRLDALKQAQTQVEQQFKNGEIGEEAFRKFQREIVATEGKLKAFQSQAASTNVKINAQADTSGIDKMKSALKELGPAAKQAASEIDDGLKTGAAAGTAAVGALVVGSTDLNNDLARLRTNAQIAGADLGLVEDAFKQITAVTGEADSAVETVSNLLASGFKDNQLQGIIEGINGAAIKFSDTLKTEGIADGIQETFATGEAIGMFSELIDRMSQETGVSLDDFNKKLAATKTESEKAALIYEYLANAGLSEVSDKYKEMNPELVKNNEATVGMQTALADLGIVLTPLVTKITEFITKLVEWAKSNPELATTLAVVSAAITAIVGVFTLLSPIISAITALWPVLATALGAISAPVWIVIGVITALVAAAIALWKNWDSVSAWLKATWNTIKTNATNAFNQIKTSVVKTWNEIKSAASSVWNGIKTFLSGLWNGLKSTASSAWKAITSSISSAVGSVRTFISNTWNAIKSTTSNTFNTIRTTISNVFNTVKSTIGNALNFIKSTIMSGFTLVVTTIRTKMNEAKTTLTSIFKQMVAVVKPSALVSAGKDLISGLINGIKNMTKNAIGAITGVVDGVINKAKSLLKINSPSKVFTQIGEWTGEGLANGIKSTTKLNEQVMTNITSRIKKATEDNAKEVTKIAQIAERDRTAIQKKYANKRVEEEQKHKEKIAKLKKGDTKKRVQLEKELSADLSKLKKSEQAELKKINDKAWKDIQAKEAEVDNLKLSYIKRFIEAKKEEGKLSLFEEAKYYRESSKQFKQNSKQQQEMQKSYQNTVTSINNAVTSTNEKFLSETKRINDELVKSEEDLTKKYNDTLNSRYESILGYYGLFDEVKKRESVSSQSLITNLQDQTLELARWRGELSKLEAKGVSETLLKDLQNMGPSVLSQLEALNSMTDQELNGYQSLYEQKSKMAYDTAVNELKPLADETQKQIQDLRNKANIELKQLNVDWQTEIANVVRGTEEKFTTLQQVGKSAVQNLMDGLQGMQPSLLKAAQTMADSIKKTLSQTLDVPINISASASKLKAATGNAMSSIANSGAKSAEAKSAQSKSQQSNVTDMGALVSAIVDLINKPNVTTVNLDGKQIATAVSKVQQKSAALKGLTKGVQVK